MPSRSASKAIGPVTHCVGRFADTQGEILTATPYLKMSFATSAGRTYRVEWSPNLTTWNTLIDNVAGTGASVEVADPLQPGGKRFYRIRQNP
jgi:hypothetical protein